MMVTFLVVGAGVLGAALASFLEVLADRLPRGKRPSGRSQCAHCGRSLLWYELIPVVSWLLLRGRCRTCAGRIPVRHLLGEVGLAFFFVLAVTTLSEPLDPWLLVFRLVLLSGFFVVVVADLRYFIIPDPISLGLTAFFLLAVLSAAWLPVPWVDALPSLTSSLFGLGFGVVFLASFAAVSRGTWMGWGDVKLAAALGLALGFPDILFTLAFAFIAGAVIGLLLIFSRRRTTSDLIPFGPFIVIGALPFLFGFSQKINYIFGTVEFIHF